MSKLEEQELLERFAYQAWLERGQPIGSPEADWETAKEKLRAHYARGKETLDVALQTHFPVQEKSSADCMNNSVQVVNATLQKRRAKAKSTSMRSPNR